MKRFWFWCLRFAKFLARLRPNLANLFFKKKYVKTLFKGSTLMQNLRQTFDLIHSEI